MNVLIVGGAGYIGSHMVRYLAGHTGYEVTVLDNLSKGHREAVCEAELMEGDFGDSELVEQLCRARRISALLHFGAHSLVGESVKHPGDYYENNVVKGKRLLDGALAGGVRYVIFSSTAAVYGEPERAPIYESDRRTPTNPYGHTKLAFEGLLESYAGANEFRYTSLRYFNAAGAESSGCIGEDHHPESHLIPLILQVALGQRDAITVYGDDYPTPDGTCIRDYIHVADLAAAHLLALERLTSGGTSRVYNLGNGQGYSVMDAIGACREVTGHPIPSVVASRRSGDPAVLIASSDRARQELGWQPRRTHLKDIIASAWHWHHSHPNGYRS